jgi:O-methyltransferase
MKQRFKDLAVWMDFPGLRANVHAVAKAGLRTLLDYQRLAMLTAAIEVTEDLPGDIIEFGTFQGGSAGVMLQRIRAAKTLHLCDSFEGMPEVSSADNFHQKGDFADTCAERVRSGLAKLGDNFQMHAGFFNKTIPEMEANDSLRFSFAHIDVDLYESVKDTLEFCYPRMVTEGIIILDDYGASTCLGAKKAADEFFSSKGEVLETLSQPAHGCIVGGGRLLDRLIGAARYPNLTSRLKNQIFERAES